MNHLRSLMSLLVVSALYIQTSFGQTVVTIPVYPTDIDSCTVIFDASQGNAGLKDVAPPIYAHTGVITNLSSSGSDWKYVIAGWSENTTKAQLTPLGNNLYQLKMKPSIRAWYGVPQGESILKLAFVFRNSDGSKTGREVNGSDVFYDIYPAVTSVNIIQPANKSLFQLLNTPIPIKATSPLATNLKIYLNNSLIKVVDGTTITDTIPAQNFGHNWVKQWVKILAINDTASVADSFCYTVIPLPSIANLPTGATDGINYIDSAKVILSLYAPGKNNCFVIGDFNNWQEDSLHYMFVTPDSKRFWVEVSSLEPRKEYLFQYLVDGMIRIADPYCDKVSDPDDQYIDPSTYPGLLPYPSGKTTEIASYLQTAQTPYSWNENLFTKPAVTDLVIYELLLRDFIEKHDYPTLIDTLNYLKRLGINAIELMPVMEFEGNSSWGYNPDFMFATDKYYGTKTELKQFVEAAHSKGIAVILDIVLNHQFGKSPLVRLYWDGTANTIAVNNPWFNQIPKHPYNVGFDFNHESIDTKAFCERVIQYWLTEYHVDGYRFDMSKGFTQKNSYPDNVSLWGQYDASRIAILKDYQNALRTVSPDAYMILEHFADNTEEIELSAAGMLLWGNMNDKYNQATMGWNTSGKSDLSWVSYKQRGWADPHVVDYMESHDEERLMFKNITYGNVHAPYTIKDTTTALKRMEMAAAFFYTVPGPKMLLEFGELGYDYSITYGGDRLSPKPPRWDYQNQWRRQYLLNVCSSLIDLKKTQQLFKTTDFSMSVSGAMKKIHLNSTSTDATIVGNFDVIQGTIDPSFQKSGKWYDYFSGDSITVVNTSDLLTLQPGEYHLFTSVKLQKPLFTAIDEPQISLISQNRFSMIYPNPTNEGFNIQFSVSTPLKVDLVIFDLNNKVIKTFSPIEFGIGTHIIHWDLMDLSGKKTDPGIYFCRINYGNKYELNKMIVQ